VRAAAAEVREGRAFCLSLPLDLPGGNTLNPRRHPPRLAPTQIDGDAYFNFPMARLDPANSDVVSDDQVLLWCQYSTQWDSLAHVGAWFDADGDGQLRKADENVGAAALAVDRLAVKPVQGRGVLVDLAAHYGRDRKLVGHDDLMAVMENDDVIVEEGDILVLRTGFAELLVEMDGRPDKSVLDATCAVLDGRDEALLNWISDSGIAAICADNYAVEAYPARPADGPRPALPLHHHCLFKLGLPLAELWYLEELGAWLRAYGRSRFLLTAPPLRLPGAVGSPVTPVATV
jgi:kynurenine formamidase